jgi:galactokinase
MNGVVIDGAATGLSSADQLGRDVAAAFAARHGRLPDTVFAAPGRVNLMGEHTDYNDGCCLPLALPRVTVAAAGRRTDGRLTLASLQQHVAVDTRLDALGPGRVHGWAAYAAGVVWAAREAGLDVPGLDLVVHSDVPVGAGLSSSAALECAVALALCALAGVRVDDSVRHQLVDICVRAERDVAGAPTGGMDQTVSLLAREGHALMIDSRDQSLRHVPWLSPASASSLLVVDTRARHALVDGGYAVRRAECVRAAEALEAASLREAYDARREPGTIKDPVLRRRARHVLTEMDRVEQTLAALEREDVQELGRQLDRSHQSLARDFEVSCDELDVACAAAVSAGALGARMTGGGFGGSVIALVRDDLLTQVQSSVAAAFADRGWHEPGLLVAVPSAGACELTGIEAPS